MKRSWSPILGASLCLTLALVGTDGHAEATVPGSAFEASGLDGLDRRLERIRREEHSIHRVLERGGGELARVERQIVLRGRAYYRLARGAPRGDLFEHAVRVERLRQALLTDLARAKTLRREKKVADQKLRLLEERRAPLEAERQATGQAQAALLAQEERERAFALAFSSSTGSRDHTAIYSAAADLDGLAETFSSMRGRLPFPMPGRAEIAEVRLPGLSVPGLSMRGYSGAVARSVYPGRVAFADEYPEYGRTVILDHGEGYFTVTARLGSIEVRVGEDLPAGARLGLATNQGGYSEIYFEIRRDRETLRPGEWFGI